MIALSAAVIGHSRIAAAFNNFKQAVERGQVLPTTDLTQTFVFDLVKDMSIYKVSIIIIAPSDFGVLGQFYVPIEQWVISWSV